MYYYFLSLPNTLAFDVNETLQQLIFLYLLLSIDKLSHKEIFGLGTCENTLQFSHMISKTFYSIL